jgi:hypothetical protein
MILKKLFRKIHDLAHNIVNENLMPYETSRILYGSLHDDSDEYEADYKADYEDGIKIKKVNDIVLNNLPILNKHIQYLQKLYV